MAAAAATFNQCLNLCGIIAPDLLQALMVTQGVNTFDVLVTLSSDDLDTVAVSINKTRRTANQGPLVLNAIALKKLKAMRLWAIWQRRCSIIPIPANFDANCLNWGIERMEFEYRCKQSDSPDSPEPDKLTKIGYDIWQGFWRQFKNYCSTKRGAMKIPISYVFREHEVPTAEILATDYADSDENLMMKVSLIGPDYLFDNKTVWGILTRLVGHGTAWPFIKHLDKTFDGRKAIQLLKTQSQGTASNSSRQARAYSTLRTTTYNGKSNRFSFNAYVEKLQFAFTELEECGIVISGNQKVDYLLANCTSPPAMDTFPTISSNETYTNDFGECCAYISQHLAKHAVYKDPDNVKRGISAIHSSNKIKFTDEEWHALSPEEKAAVKIKRQELKKKEKKAVNNAGNQQSNTNKSLKRANTKLKKQIAALQADDNTADDTGTSDEEVEMKKPSPMKKSKSNKA
jgi:hypothetical protein